MKLLTVQYHLKLTNPGRYDRQFQGKLFNTMLCAIYLITNGELNQKPRNPERKKENNTYAMVQKLALTIEASCPANITIRMHSSQRMNM